MLKIFSVVIFLVLFCWSFAADQPSTEKSDNKNSSKEEIKRYGTIHIQLEPAISKKFIRGVNFIYDCHGRYFACVDDEGFEKCTNERKKAITMKYPILPCAPLKKFTTKKDCENAQYSNIHIQSAKAFCMDAKKVIFVK